jgi:aldehyde dehydrogenase (NAD+)
MSRAEPISAGNQIRNQLLINGDWKKAVSGQTFPTYNPGNAELITNVQEGNADDIDLAVKAARKAFDQGPWRRMSARDKGKLLRKVAQLMADHFEEFVYLETLDKGKPITESRNVDVPISIETFEYFAGMADKISGDTLPVRGNFLNYTTREPVGVVGQIIPWNFPLLMAAWKIAPALACGNTVVLKPAEQTPLSALLLGELCMEAGIPEGVVNVVPGYGPTAGEALVVHPEVDKIAFTGSTEVGKLIMEKAARTLKRVTLELGGKSPNIVFADAEIDESVSGALTGIYFNQGECCSAGSRFFPERPSSGEFLELLVGRSKGRKVGDPFDESTEMGAQVSQEQLDRILDYIEIGKQQGAQLACGGNRLEINNGYFVEPTVFRDVDNKSRISQEEIFGPVVCAIPFDTIDEVIEEGNRTSYGLAAAVWTKDVKKAHQLARDLRAGTVWINTYHNIDVGSPWGGFKESGIGREMGPYNVEHYTEIKSVWIAL